MIKRQNLTQKSTLNSPIFIHTRSKGLHVRNTLAVKKNLIKIYSNYHASTSKLNINTGSTERQNVTKRQRVAKAFIPYFPNKCVALLLIFQPYDMLPYLFFLQQLCDTT